MSGSFCRPLRFCVDDVVRWFFWGFFLKRYRSGSNRTPPHRTFLVFFVPPRLVYPILAVRPFSWCVSRGAILGPARFLDSPGTYVRGLSSLTPSEALSGREAARVFLCFILFLVFGFGSQGPKRIAPRAFCLEGVPFSGCPWALTHTFCSLPQVFCFLGPRGLRPKGSA